MSDRLSSDALAAIRARAEKASPGPWVSELSMHSDESAHFSVRTVECLPEHPWSPRYVFWVCGSIVGDMHGHPEKPRWRYCDACKSGHWERRRLEIPIDARRDGHIQADAEFAAHARTDVPDLLAHVDALEAENRELREALGQIRQHIRDNWNHPSASTILGIVDSTPGMPRPKPPGDRP